MLLALRFRLALQTSVFGTILPLADFDRLEQLAVLARHDVLRYLGQVLDVSFLLLLLSLLLRYDIIGVSRLLLLILLFFFHHDCRFSSKLGQFLFSRRNITLQISIVDEWRKVRWEFLHYKNGYLSDSVVLDA